MIRSNVNISQVIVTVSLLRNCIQLAACGKDQLLPMNPELAAADPGTSPEEFVTPVGSPTLPKKKSFDTISTGSSAAEEDLMGQILKEMHSKTEGESIYSSLMRKDKKNRKKKALE